MSNYYGEQEKLASIQGQFGSVEVRNRQIIPNLKAQRAELTARIEKIDQLLQILEKNPDFIRMLDLTRELI